MRGPCLAFEMKLPLALSETTCFASSIGTRRTHAGLFGFSPRMHHCIALDPVKRGQDRGVVRSIIANTTNGPRLLHPHSGRAEQNMGRLQQQDAPSQPAHTLLTLLWPSSTQQARVASGQ